MKAVVYALLVYKYVIIVGLHLYALDWRLSQENMSLQVDFLLKPFEAYSRMCFRIRLLKWRFYIFYFLQWAHCQLRHHKLSVDRRLWMTLSPNVSLVKEEKDRTETEGRGMKLWGEGRGWMDVELLNSVLEGTVCLGWCNTASLPFLLVPFLYLLF